MMVPGSVSQHRGSALSLQREPKKAVPGADLFQRRFRDAEDAPAVVNSEPFCWEGRIECGHRTSHLHLLIIFSHLAMWASSWGDIFDQASDTKSAGKGAAFAGRLQGRSTGIQLYTYTFSGSMDPAAAVVDGSIPNRLARARDDWAAATRAAIMAAPAP